uniref:Uncharacterized protein n=1 Tax=Trypanosoma congolense (strain IL3000) TaxID=1068625 RepID=G0URL6_TRYCI|nr:hypothetical protein, unlikely [Trypanosoma congolense IL3000]
MDVSNSSKPGASLSTGLDMRRGVRVRVAMTWGMTASRGAKGMLDNNNVCPLIHWFGSRPYAVYAWMVLGMIPMASCRLFQPSAPSKQLSYEKLYAAIFLLTYPCK